jgi:hypothetical protein
MGPVALSSTVMPLERGPRRPSSLGFGSRGSLARKSHERFHYSITPAIRRSSTPRPEFHLSAASKTPDQFFSSRGFGKSLTSPTQNLARLIQRLQFQNVLELPYRIFKFLLEILFEIATAGNLTCQT